ncbi:MAG: flotillin family protein [Flavobacteriales bacterium]|nr:flotillin family protein [Flavobacteriales bacterium]
MNTGELASNMTIIIGVVVAIIVIGLLVAIAKFYKKASQGQAIVRTGVGGTKISFAGMMVWPVIHKMEFMDISLKTIVIERLNTEGLICRDNMRADIKVAFFVRVNQMKDDVIKVAQSVGCERASNPKALNELFEAKFSEALKTVGKKFDFVDLYNKRDEFRQEILNLIGKDLNGYILDDAAIDYLEQTRIAALSSDNILDAEGIKKITELTAAQKILSNKITREEEKTIKQQDVEAREAILELERQLAEKEEKQKREIANIQSRENAEIIKVNEEERLKSERARIATEEEVMIAEENKQRQVIVAAKNKERTLAIQTEQVEKDRQLEINERERIVTLAQIEKEKALEVEKKNIQEVIRERVAIEKTVVDEEEKIKDTKAFAEADRSKEVAIKQAEQQAQAQLVLQIKSAEAAKQAAEHQAKRKIIEAEAAQQAANQEAEAIKILADAEATRQAAVGLAEAKVMTAKADAREKQGEAEANVIEAQAIAKAKGIEVESAAQAEADSKLGLAKAKVELEKGKSEAEVINIKAAAIKEEGFAQANVMKEKLNAEAEGIRNKAEAMKQLDGVGQEHEEFKLRLNKERDVELAHINIQKEIAAAQASVLAQALQTAKIDIVGGEQVFFDKIVNAVSNAKMIDQYTKKSEVIGTVSNQILDGKQDVLDKVKSLLSTSNIKSDDIKNLSISALLMKLIQKSKSDEDKSFLQELLGLAQKFGFDQNSAGSLGIE